MPVRAVLLDLGGTLFSYRKMDRPQVELLTRAVDRLGVGVETGPAIDAYRRASREAWTSYAARPFYLHRDLFRHTFGGFARHLGGEATVEFLDWFHEEQLDLAVSHMELRPGCEQTLSRLRAAGLHVGIVSNIDEDYLRPMLKRSGLDSLVDARTSSEEAQSCKPDSRIFFVALEKAAARVEEALFVGDSPEADVYGARRVGMATVLIREDGPPPPGTGAGPRQEPDHEIHELPELLEIARVAES